MKTDQRKKINVTPGKSITCDDVLDAEEGEKNVFYIRVKIFPPMRRSFSSLRFCKRKYVYTTGIFISPFDYVP